MGSSSSQELRWVKGLGWAEKLGGAAGVSALVGTLKPPSGLLPPPSGSPPPPKASRRASSGAMACAASSCRCSIACRCRSSFCRQRVVSYHVGVCCQSVTAYMLSPTHLCLLRGTPNRLPPALVRICLRLGGSCATVNAHSCRASAAWRHLWALTGCGSACIFDARHEHNSDPHLLEAHLLDLILKFGHLLLCLLPPHLCECSASFCQGAQFGLNPGL